MNRILRENAHNGVTAADTLETTTFTVKSCKHQPFFSTNAEDTGTRNWRQKPVPVSAASDMKFSTKFFRYRFMVTHRMMLRFRDGL